MKKLLAIATLLVGSGSAYAVDFNLSTVVPETVSLSTPSNATLTTTDPFVSFVDSTPGNTALNFNANGGILTSVHSSSPTAKLTFASANSGKLVSDYAGTVPTGWAKEVSYTLTFGDGNVGLGSTSTLPLTIPQEVVIGSVVNKDITALTITPTGTLPLVSGKYSDTLTVTISAT